MSLNYLQLGDEFLGWYQAGSSSTETLSNTYSDNSTSIPSTIKFLLYDMIIVFNRDIA